MNEAEERSNELIALQDRLAFHVDDLEVLDQALTHASSAADADGPQYNYESLEFLGDAVLGLAVAHHLFEAKPDLTPGEYSRMRAGLVNRRTLAKVARAIDIAPTIRLGKGEEMSGGRKRASLLADCIEAMIGAIYLDQGYGSAQDFIERIFAEEMDKALTVAPVWDYKSRLQHHCQAERIPLPRFVVVRSEGPDHSKEFEIAVYLRGEAVGSGVGSSKKEAEQHAARAALEYEGVKAG